MNKTTLIKKNYQIKQKFTGVIGYNYEGKLLVEVKKESEKIVELTNFQSFPIFAKNLNSAISIVKRKARKEYISTNEKPLIINRLGNLIEIDPWNNQNIPILICGLNLKEQPKWSSEIKTKAPLSKNSHKVRKYNKKLKKKLNHKNKNFNLIQTELNIK